MSDVPPPPPDESGWSSQPPPPSDPPASAAQAGAGWATYGTGENAELAGAGSRLGARLIDAVIFAIVAIVLFIVVAIASFGDLVDDTVDDNAIEEASEGLIVVSIMVMAVGMLYEVSLTALKGQTLGKMAVRIRVVSAESGSLPGWGKAFGRWFVPSIVGVIGLRIPFIGLLALVVYASLLWDKRRQGWHDKAAKTLVIKV